MNSYKCYWKYEGKLCRMDVSQVSAPNEAIEAVKDSLTFNSAHSGQQYCVLAVVK